jgi:putative protease
LVVDASVGQPLTIEAIAATGQRCSLAADQPCREAMQHALTPQTLRDQLGRLGGTSFELRNLTARIAGRPMLPFSVLGRLRHELVQELTRTMSAPAQRRIAADSVLPRLKSRPKDADGARESTPEKTELIILCRSLPQLEEVLQSQKTASGEFNSRTVYVDFQDIREYRDAVALAHAQQSQIYLATPRIQKQGESGIFHALAKQGADGILVRNLSGLRFFQQRGIETIADFSLNAANELTVQYLLEQGAARVTPSYDLNRDQLLDLVQAASADRLEVVIHQHMPMFHMEHCVFCAVLSPGTNKTNCGRPCDHHQVRLRDRVGIEHPLTADVGCRNTLFNAVPQSGAELVPQLLARGVRRFRLELLSERGRQLDGTLHLYQELLAGSVTGKEVWSRLKATNRIGITRGTLEERRPLLAIG